MREVSILPYYFFDKTNHNRVFILGHVNSPELPESRKLDQNNNTLVSGNTGDKENLHLDGRKLILLSIFRSYSLFFFSFFSFFWSLFCCCCCLFVCCFLKLKMYILIHIWLSERVSDKNFFTRPISESKTTFLVLRKWQKIWKKSANT